MNEVFTETLHIFRFQVLIKLVVIVAAWVNGHHVDLENKDLQVVIHVDHEEYEGNDHGVKRINYHPRQEYDDRNSVEDAFDVDVGRDYLGLNSVNGVDDEGCQQEHKRIQ